MSVEDIANQTSVIFEHDEEDPFSGFMIPKVVQTLVRRNGIANYHLIAHSFSNISAKNYKNWLMCIEVIVCNVTVVFLRHSVLWQ